MPLNETDRDTITQILFVYKWFWMVWMVWTTNTIAFKWMDRNVMFDFNVWMIELWAVPVNIHTHCLFSRIFSLTLSLSLSLFSLSSYSSQVIFFCHAAIRHIKLIYCAKSKRKKNVAHSLLCEQQSNMACKNIFNNN